MADQPRAGQDVEISQPLPAGTNVIGGANIRPATSGGLSAFHLVSAATTNATSVKASAGQVFGWFVVNTASAYRYVKFHNTAGTPTAGSGVVWVLGIPGGGAANLAFETGIAFTTGIAITTVTGVADTDATAVAANDLNINIFYA